MMLLSRSKMVCFCSSHGHNIKEPSVPWWVRFACIWSHELKNMDFLHDDHDGSWPWRGKFFVTIVSLFCSFTQRGIQWNRTSFVCCNSLWRFMQHTRVWNHLNSAAVERAPLLHNKKSRTNPILKDIHNSFKGCLLPSQSAVGYALCARWTFFQVPTNDIFLIWHFI